MTFDHGSWCDDVWSALARLPAGVGDDARQRWETHALRDALVVTFFGPYDSGKSSLIKRLLVDSGQPVPDWLTVSARRETFEVKEARLGRLLLRDTPGVAGGNSLHELAAKDAVLVSDLIVVVLPPQLVTSERQYLTAILTGAAFGCPARAAFLDAGLAVVLSRMDEAGAMPRDDLAGYAALSERKRNELFCMVRAAQGAEEVLAVHALSADPFGLVGNATPRGPEEFDADRAWDGVAAFASFLGGLDGRKEELRQRAEMRFLGAELGALRVSLEGLDAENRIAVDAATNEAAAHGLAQDRLRAALGAARADLDRRIEEEISAATRRGASDADELRTVVSSRVHEALERWSRQHDAALDALSREADLELQARRARPAWQTLAGVLEKPPELDDPSAANDIRVRPAVDKGQRLLSVLRAGYRDLQPVMLGMPLEKARSELSRLHQAPSFEEYVRQTRSGATRLRDTAHAARAKRAVWADLGLDIAVPAMLELGTLLAEVWLEHEASKRRAAQRERVRGVIDASAKRLADRAWDTWYQECLPGSMAAALASARDSAEVAAASLRAEGTCIAAALVEVRALLARLDPEPP